MSHPSIVTIYDIVEERDYIFIAMEYVDGGSVGGAQTAANGPLPADTCMRIVRYTAAELGYAHGRGIVHRDIKPANLLLHSSGQVKITDFGVAKLIGANLKTTAHTIVGTLDYMSPEQIKGERVDGRTDQFSLAIVAYRVLTGQRPFTGHSFYTFSQRICLDPTEFASRVNPTLNPEVDAVLQRALAKNPAEHTTCGEFADALSAAVMPTGGRR